MPFNGIRTTVIEDQSLFLNGEQMKSVVSFRAKNWLQCLACDRLASVNAYAVSAVLSKHGDTSAADVPR